MLFRRQFVQQSQNADSRRNCTDYLIQYSHFIDEECRSLKLEALVLEVVQVTRAELGHPVESLI